MHLAMPFNINRQGRVATVDEETHIREMIEQVLFTVEGERVNRPNFGAGVLQLIFSSLDPAMLTARRVAVQSSIQRWLGHAVHVTNVAFDIEGDQLRITVEYQILKTGQVKREAYRISRGGGGQTPQSNQTGGPKMQSEMLGAKGPQKKAPPHG